jgi:hypothetical protein
MDCLFLFEDNCYNKVGDRMGGGQPSDARGEEEEEGAADRDLGMTTMTTTRRNSGWEYDSSYKYSTHKRN